MGKSEEIRRYDNGRNKGNLVPPQLSTDVRIAISFRDQFTLGFEERIQFLIMIEPIHTKEPQPTFNLNTSTGGSSFS